MEILYNLTNKTHLVKNLQCPKCWSGQSLEYINGNYSCIYCLVEWDKLDTVEQNRNYNEDFDLDD